MTRNVAICWRNTMPPLSQKTVLYVLIFYKKTPVYVASFTWNKGQLPFFFGRLYAIIVETKLDKSSIRYVWPQYNFVLSSATCYFSQLISYQRYIFVVSRTLESSTERRAYFFNPISSTSYYLVTRFYLRGKETIKSTAFLLIKIKAKRSLRYLPDNEEWPLETDRNSIEASYRIYIRLLSSPNQMNKRFYLLICQ